jgi:anion-transporting  ArsA/GET3 family ATPase
MLPRSDGRVLRQPPAALAHRAVPLAAVHGGVEAVLPGGRSRARLAVPQDIADFFVLFQAMESGFVRRAREVEALLVDPRTAFVVVTTLETAPSHEARFLARSLLERGMALGAIVANRVLPEALARHRSRRQRRCVARPADGPLADAVAERLDAPVKQVRSVLTRSPPVRRRRAGGRSRVGSARRTGRSGADDGVGPVARRRHPRPRRARSLAGHLRNGVIIRQNQR